MSNERSLVFTEGVALQTAPGVARILALNTANEDLSLEDLGLISEWLSIAWKNLAGEEHRPVVISERGYVSQDSIRMSSDPGPGDQSYGREYILERDCE